jgi:hypothetical protein
MTNTKLLNLNFRDKLEDLKEELSPYLSAMQDYEKYLDFSEYPNRVAIVYPVGNTQKSLYASRNLDKKRPVNREFETYSSLQLFFPGHQTLNHTLQLKEGKYSEDIITEIKYNIYKETGYDVLSCEAAIATKYENYTLQPHIDGGKQEGGVTNRIHLVLESSETSYFEDENNNRYNPKEGEVWDLDVTRTHAAGNHSPQRVTHLVLDYKG